MAFVLLGATGFEQGAQLNVAYTGSDVDYWLNDVSYDAGLVHSATSPHTGTYRMNLDWTGASIAQAALRNVQYGSADGIADNDWVYISAWFNPSANPSSPRVIMSNNGTDNSFYLELQTDGTLKIYYHDVSNLNAAFGSLPTGTWTPVCMGWKWSSIGGRTDFMVWVGTGAPYDGTNKSDTVYTPDPAVGSITGGNIGLTLGVDDFCAFYEDSGLGPGAAPPPLPIVGAGMFPNAAGTNNSAGWVGVADTTDRYKNWDDVGAVDLTDYNTRTNNAAGSQLLSSATNNVTISGTVMGVIEDGVGDENQIGKASGGTKFLLLDSSSGTPQLGSQIATAGPLGVRELFKASGSGAAWTQTTLDSLEVGGQMTPGDADIGLIHCIHACAVYYTTSFTAPATGFAHSFAAVM